SDLDRFDGKALIPVFRIDLRHADAPVIDGEAKLGRQAALHVAGDLFGVPITVGQDMDLRKLDAVTQRSGGEDPGDQPQSPFDLLKVRQYSSTPPLAHCLHLT